ncbi:hypothetical protein [Flammeovirga sp. SJP92]|uniref:hypothetical protein n=1 Tax=Flammeovirga sp. SJP92 TaxID=1775430 RepID=UPI000786DE1D|nr:hypothetical protein [Flammeovirga sp. SJP92]KXX71263.1 hypothetical protein AVL50_09405 [Flammeovirga sp. SJP92]
MKKTFILLSILLISVKVFSQNQEIKGHLTVTKSILANEPLEAKSWDDLWQCGFFDAHSLPSAPESSGWFWGVNLGHRSNLYSDAKYGGQLLIKHSPSTPTLYFRSRSAEGLGTWAKVLHNQGDQTLGGNLMVGSYYADESTQNDFLGKKIYFGGAHLNGDAVWMGRYNESRENTHLRINIGDDGADIFDIGYNHWNGGGWQSRFKINMYGNAIIHNSLCIGTTSRGDYKLSVAGKIRAEEVKVYTGWADYVFEEDYNLKSLSEVEAHIKEHKHLPDVPSAKEVEENGVNVGETEAMLLRKIEELTLYTIEQEKRLNHQDQRLDEQNETILKQQQLILQLLNNMEQNEK